MLAEEYRSGTLHWTSGITGRKDTIGYELNMNARPYIRLTYTTTTRTGEKIDSDYRISLTTTGCYLGGERYWFLCPGCVRRAGILYQTSQSTTFICRKCNNLTYKSCNESHANSRSFFKSFFQMSMFDTRILKHFRKIKRWQYRGKPTKKALKFYRMVNRFENMYEHLKEQDDRISDTAEKK